MSNRSPSCPICGRPLHVDAPLAEVHRHETCTEGCRWFRMDFTDEGCRAEILDESFGGPPLVHWTPEQYEAYTEAVTVTSLVWAVKKELTPCRS